MSDIIDTHTHVIASDPVRYPLAPLGGHQSTWSQEHPVDHEGLLAAMDAAGIAKAVVVQASTVYGHDNRYAVESVKAHPDRFIGVFSADVMAPDAVDQIKRWTEAGMVGIRLFTTGTTMPGQATWLNSEQSFPAWSYCEAHDIPVCLQMTQDGIPMLVTLLQRFPRVRVLLDHLARPRLDDGPPYAQAKALFDLAAYPGVFLKLTNRTVTLANVGRSTAAAFVPFVVEAFGAGRIAWGSNFPAAEESLPALLAEARQGLAPLSQTDRDMILGGTAKRIYPSLRDGMIPVTLDTVLGTYPHTIPLKDGTVTDPAVRLAFTEIEPIHKAFAPMVRRQAYDLSEVAIVTYLQAAGYDKPLILLPIVVASRLQRGCIVYYRPNGVVTPRDLPAKRIGVRAYTQTTGMWVRAALAEDYGLPIEKMHWVTQDPAHVEEYRDPPIVEHAPKDKGLVEMLMAGDIDACILGNDLPKDPDFVPVIADHKDVDAAWKARHGFQPPNHVVCVKSEVARKHPEAVRAAYRMMVEADEIAKRNGTASGKSLFGFEALHEPLQITLDTCNQQLLLPRPLTVDALLAPARALLGDLG